MSFRFSVSSLPLLLVMIGCGGAGDPLDVAEANVETSEASIVRGQVDAGHPQVMALMIPNLDGSETLCSATLYAKRTLVTAAHCLTKAAAVFAYRGNDYFGDFPQLFNDPSTWRNWSLAKSWKLHPSWNPKTLNADIAVVQLEGDVGVTPMPLELRLLGPANVGEKVSIVGYGGTASPDNVGAIDAYVKRVGSTSYLGSPAASPLPPNPHPGLRDAKIRAQLMKLDGRAPRANACFGDSGGPALTQVLGRQRIAGVSSWVGDNCEGFSYYVRINAFLPFLIKEALGAMAQ